MKIEGDYLIFSSGKRLYSYGGTISIDYDGDLLTDSEDGHDDPRTTPTLTDQEKWELARYMIERWMDVRDQLWARHEETMRAEPMEGGIVLPEEASNTVDGLKTTTESGIVARPTLEEGETKHYCAISSCPDYDMNTISCVLTKGNRQLLCNFKDIKED